jgi:hypothetical protein
VAFYIQKTECTLLQKLVDDILFTLGFLEWPFWFHSTETLFLYLPYSILPNATLFPPKGFKSPRFCLCWHGFDTCLHERPQQIQFAAEKTQHQCR